MVTWANFTTKAETPGSPMISEVTVSEGDYELSSNISISNPAESQDSQTPDIADFPRCQSSQILFCFTEL